MNTTAAPDAPARTRWLVALVLIGCGVIAAAHIGKVAPAIPALRDDLGEPLVGVLEHAHLLLLHPRDARPDALEALGSAGWGREAIVTWSQLVSFVAFRARVVAGLAVLAPKES